MPEVDNTDAIIFPKKGKKSPQMGSVAVMAGTETDLVLLCKLLDFDAGAHQDLFTSRLYISKPPTSGPALSFWGGAAPFLIGSRSAILLFQALPLLMKVLPGIIITMTHICPVLPN
jgi:hypothetical protein